MATKEYFETVRVALDADDEVLLDQVYNPVMTKRCGLQIMEALLGKVSEGFETVERIESLVGPDGQQAAPAVIQKITLEQS